MMKRTIVALAAMFAVATIAPVAHAEGCNGSECDRTTRIKIELPDEFGFAHAEGSFSASADKNEASASGESSATAASANGGTADANNTTSAGATATDGATAGGTSTSSASTSD